MTNESLIEITVWLARYYARVGFGEEGGNNRGPDVEYFRETDGTGKPVKVRSAWCGSFASSCFVQITKWMHCDLPFKTSRGAKRLARNMAEAPGGVAVDWELDAAFMEGCRGGLIAWHRGWPISWKGHVGIWYKYEAATDTLWVVEGNTKPQGVHKGLDGVHVKIYKNGSWRKRCAIVSTMV